MDGLVKLRHLRLDGTGLKQMPAGMEKMTQLRTLSKFVVGEENGPGIAVLKNLSNLQEKLHISGLSNVVEDTDAIDANFQQKKYLNEVILNWGEDEFRFRRGVSFRTRNLNVEEEFMGKLSFHENLTKLTIRGYGGKKFPEWIKDLTKLVYLEIDKLPNLKTISNGLKNLTSLRRLRIRNCVKLESLPEEGFPETLGKLYIRNCPLLEQRCEKGGADWSKIAHIPDFEYRDDSKIAGTIQSAGGTNCEGMRN